MCIISIYLILFCIGFLFHDWLISKHSKIIPLYASALRHWSTKISIIFPPFDRRSSGEIFYQQRLFHARFSLETMVYLRKKLMLQWQMMFRYCPTNSPLTKTSEGIDSLYLPNVAIKFIRQERKSVYEMVLKGNNTLFSKNSWKITLVFGVISLRVSHSWYLTNIYKPNTRVIFHLEHLVLFLF